jgi:hypothetical protein
VADGDHVNVVRGEGDGADIRAPLAEGERARERKRLTSRPCGQRRREQGLAARERACSGGPRGSSAGERARWEAWARIGPAERRGEVFSFFSLFFSLIPFLLYTNIHLFMIISRCQNEMLCVKCYYQSWFIHMRNEMLMRLGFKRKNKGGLGV